MEITIFSNNTIHNWYGRMESNPQDVARSKISRGYIFVISILLVLSSISSGCLEDEQDHSRTIEFSVFVYASGPAEIFVPLPEYTPMVKRLFIEDGEGDFEVVDTPYGRCLRITLDSFIKIDAKVYPSEPDEIKGMTANLTTMEPNLVDDEYRYFWCNATRDAVNDFRILIDMEENGVYTNYYYNSMNSENVTVGWHLYPGEYSHGKRLAP